MSSDGLLRALAERVLDLRRERGLSRTDLAARSGLSVRFLARVEGGDGNISIRRLADLATALDTSVDQLLRPPSTPDGIVCLVGLRGAGKSTVGPLLAERLRLPFLEMDSVIRDAAGLPIDQIFELHGEASYRRLEREAVHAILGRGVPLVMAAAGGVVNDAETWRTLRERTLTAWLRAEPEDHWRRVVAQGDGRPMANHPAAMDDLRGILSAREPLYALARITVDTARVSVGDVVDLLERQIRTHQGPS
jgi:XRE family transcriptional regulator, aerobic/anaerobic benzoate catabolism transcriptional regulator